ncbi:MAG: acyl-CoA dehydrogenase, partial [Deltaproteobacteria bacterium]|nr:acyl-CoA dehydrogenase [Deltaproteobacteria bacterium]
MPDLLSDQRDMEFTIFEQLQADKLCAHEPYKEFSRDLFEMIMTESLKMSAREAMPLNAVGDREGCRMEDGQVNVPKAFQEPWRLFTEWGWIVLTEPPDVGGQGIPQVIGLTCLEHTLAANYSFYSFLSLTKGAVRLIQNFGTEDQKNRYMFKMLEGQWAGTMCLTEPNAGSDVGAVKTMAKRNPDGTFSISGSKIFITDGDHDLTENIIHPVLARIEGAPAGTRGISLFLVPKYCVNDDGSLGEFNDIKVTGLEEKMGLHGSPTCAMNFGEDGKCVGELLGEENRGMRIMFQMMNEARLGVGLAGMALASTAYLHSLEYAKERIQGTDFREAGNPDAPSVPIIRHPDVRRMLMYMKSLVEGMRGMIYFGAYCMDRVSIATDDEDRSKWQGFVDLLIPVIKGYSSEMGFRVVETAMQVYGGYGYVSEYPVEQFLRDSKITSIFEGTNGIQAMDLVGRKLGMKGGSIFDRFLGEIGDFVALAREKAGL